MQRGFTLIEAVVVSAMTAGALAGAHMLLGFIGR
jgi:prepilin-type N-terminal cleavage/methylation domain-containing protein